jgi:hypothetical protein
LCLAASILGSDQVQMLTEYPQQRSVGIHIYIVGFFIDC